MFFKLAISLDYLCHISITMKAIFTILGNVLVNMDISHYTKNIFSTIIQSRVIQLIILNEICPYFPQYLRKDFETFQIISNWGYKVICELFTNEYGRIMLIGNFTMWHIRPYSISRPYLTLPYLTLPYLTLPYLAWMTQLPYQIHFLVTILLYRPIIQQTLGMAG